MCLCFYFSVGCREGLLDFCDEVGIASISSVLLVHENFFPCFCHSLGHIGESEENPLFVHAEDLSVEVKVGIACLDELVEIISISIKCFWVVQSDLFGCGGSHIVFWFFVTIVPIELFSDCRGGR